MAVELDKTAPALVLKIGGQCVHHGTVGIIRSLGKLQVPVYVATDQRFSPAAMSRYLAGKFAWNSGRLDSSFVEFLSRVASQLRHRAILIPANDHTAAFVAKNSSVLASRFLFPPIPSSLPGQLANKKDLYALCEKLGVPYPEGAIPVSELEEQQLIESACFPMVVKAADAELLPEGARSTSIARSRDELAAICRRARHLHSPNLIFQQYIPEHCSEDWIFHAYRNEANGSLVTFTGRKLRSHPPDAGITARGVAIWNEELNRQAVHLLNAIGYSGIADLDYRLDRRDGVYKLLDFNPRIGANFRMFQNLAGVDVVRAMHLDMTGKAIPQSPQSERRLFIVEPCDLAARVNVLCHGNQKRDQQPFPQETKSGEKSRELAWFDWRDPLPFVSMAAHVVTRVLQRRIEGLARFPNRKAASAPPASGSPAAISAGDVAAMAGANESPLNTTQVKTLEAPSAAAGTQ